MTVSAESWLTSISSLSSQVWWDFIVQLGTVETLTHMWVVLHIAVTSVNKAQRNWRSLSKLYIGLLILAVGLFFSDLITCVPTSGSLLFYLHTDWIGQLWYIKPGQTQGTLWPPSQAFSFFCWVRSRQNLLKYLS